MPDRPNIQVHPSAVVDEPCEIGEGTKIWHFCHVMAGAHIGRGCVLGQNVYVGGRARLGDGVKVQNNVSVYDQVVLEDDVFCGPSAVFTNVVNPRAAVDRKHDYRPTLVKRGASIGANATVVCGVTLGEYCFVAAGAVVTRDVPAYALVRGAPARRAGWFCACGDKLAGSGDIRCAGCGKRYAITDDSCRPLD
jgi:UDP-2-acetamido-3-amino-2,3-dideoxy-glucuronate N-acetyltransferase